MPDQINEAPFEYIKKIVLHRYGCDGIVLTKDVKSASVILNMRGSDKLIIMPPFLGGLDLRTVLEWQDAGLQMISADDFVKDTTGESEIPVFLTDGGCLQEKLICLEENKIIINFDLLGTIFYILARTEEYCSPVRDSHDRFPASASHALQNGYLHRPVVDELIEVLWSCIKHLWPGAERKRTEFRTMLTHDVDSPFEHLFRPAWRAMRIFGGDIFCRHSPALAFNRATLWVDVKYLGGWQRDPHYTFEKIMDISESNGLKSAFYFLAGQNSSKDGEYRLIHPQIAALMKCIHDRGHEIGYHGSYTTYLDADATRREVNELKEAISTLKIEQTRWGGRQHYLRWSAPATWRNYAEAGLDYDTTLSYADHAGFRCGTCHPFQVFDVEQGNAVNLTEYPLVVMECSVLDERYMDLPLDESFSNIKELKDTCKRYGGIFTFLWHNTRLLKKEELTLYKDILNV